MVQHYRAVIRPIFTDAMGVFSIPRRGPQLITGPSFRVWASSPERRVRVSEWSELCPCRFFNFTNHSNFDRPGLIFDTTNFDGSVPAELAADWFFAEVELVGVHT
jgi:hypothetical protein